MAKKKKATGPALVCMVVDKSGSMAARRQDTVDGCNRFIRETTEADPEALFSLVMFDTEVRRLHTGTRISAVEQLTPADYFPAGGTALLDAVGAAVKDIDDMKVQPSKVVVAIFTDGEENSSHEYSREALKATVAAHEKDLGWQFLFLGANLDSYSEAGALGSSRSKNATNWTPSSVGTRGVYAMASMSTSSYLTGATATADVTPMAYAAAVNMVQAEDDAATSGSTPSSTQTLDAKINARAARSASLTKPSTTGTPASK